MYRLLRPLLFSIDPERVHDWTLASLARVSANRYALAALSSVFRFDDPRLRVRAFGTEFMNPLGLAAGLDKNAVAVPAWRALSFGFVEVGSVTAVAQPGNPKPRLFRLVADQALVNRMGFNNRGAEALASRLSGLPGDAWKMPVLVNVGKSRSAELAAAADDYRRSLELVWPVADGIVINVSSPNTPGLRNLQAPELLSPILTQARELQVTRRLPVILKLAPDLNDAELIEIASVAEAGGVAALVAVNTTIRRDGVVRDSVPEGGLSGRPLAPRATQVLKLLAGHSRLPVISSGGIFDAADAIARLRSGASLVEIYTGFVYRGPAAVKEILQGILEHLDRSGLPDVMSLIGSDLRDTDR